MEKAVKLSSKYQITIPSEIRKLLSLKSGDILVFEIRGKEAVIKKTSNTLFDLKGVVKTNVNVPLDRIRESVRKNIGNRIKKELSNDNN